jgi:hypothetical protein
MRFSPVEVSKPCHQQDAESQVEIEIKQQPDPQDPVHPSERECQAEQGHDHERDEEHDFSGLWKDVEREQQVEDRYTFGIAKVLRCGAEELLRFLHYGF